MWPHCWRYVFWSTRNVHIYQVYIALYLNNTWPLRLVLVYFCRYGVVMETRLLHQVISKRRLYSFSSVYPIQCFFCLSVSIFMEVLFSAAINWARKLGSHFYLLCIFYWCIYSSSSQLQFYTDLKIHVISLAVEQKYFKTWTMWTR